jgi:hypothetical protein
LPIFSDTSAYFLTQETNNVSWFVTPSEHIFAFVGFFCGGQFYKYFGHPCAVIISLGCV